MKKIRKMKKVLAFILALTLVLGMSAVAFAGEATYSGDEDIIIEEEEATGGMSTQTFTKQINVTKRVEGDLREAGEKFEIELLKREFLGSTYRPTGRTISLAKDETGSFSISFLENPGRYRVRENLTSAQQDYYDVDIHHSNNNKKATVTNTAKFIPPVYEDWNPITINKELTINNEGTLNPAETFNFLIGAGSGERDGNTIVAPAFNPNTFAITVGQGGTAGSADITLPNFTKVGVYTYPVTETAGSTAGMNYDSGTYYLVVTVINNPDFGIEEDAPQFLRVLTLTDENDVKDDTFENDFDAGDLVIKKETTGNFTDSDDEFTVTVTLTPVAGKTLVDDAIDHTGSTSYYQDPATSAVTITYTIKKDSIVSIKNIPYDVTYTVEEAQALNYDAPLYDGNEEGAIEAASISTTITNNRDTEIDTGINLDNIPYILMIVVVTGGLVGLTLKKRFTGRE